jgi:hypothetical protein
MSQHTLTTVPTRVPPPGDEAVTRFYEAQQQDEKWRATDASEMNALAHLRGWTHFGPACPICFPGAS